MTLEDTPGSVQVTDHLRIAIVPAGSNALSAAILSGGTVKDLTYSLTPDGWNFPQAETEVVDERLANGNVGSKPGKTKNGPIAVKYVYGSAADVAKAALAFGIECTLVYRDVILNETAWAAGQKVDTIEITAGRQRKDTPTADGLFTTSQNLMVKAGGYKKDQTLVA